jgi:hypothetical protein
VTDTYIRRWIDEIGNWWKEEFDGTYQREWTETEVEWDHEWQFSLGLHVSIFSHVNCGVITDMAMGITEVTSYVVYVDGEVIIPPFDFSLISVGSHHFDLWVQFQNGTSTDYSGEMRILNYVDLSIHDNFHRISLHGYTYYEVNVTNNSFDTTVVTLVPSSVPDGWLASVGTTVQLAPQTSNVMNLLVCDNTTDGFASATIEVTGTALNYTSSASTFTVAEGSVGGFTVPVDKLSLLTPYVGLASTTLVAAVASAIYVKRVKRRKEKQ